MQFASFYPLLYQILKPAFPNCLWSGATDKKAIALTFDDGPHRDYTPPLLAVLERYQVRASFFWLGSCVERNRDLAREVKERGHWIGLHGYDHRSFPLLTPVELKESLVRTQNAIAEACQLNPEQVRDVRPPNGLFTPKILTLLHQWNYRPVMWSVVPEDWVSPGISLVNQRILQQVTNGSLIVLHDGYCGGRDVAKITDYLIPQLQQQGYYFVTLDSF